jgi:hypothetical protein
MDWTNPNPTDRDEWIAQRLLASEWGRDHTEHPVEHVRFYGHHVGIRWAEERASLSALQSVLDDSETPWLGNLSWWASQSGYALPWSTQGQPDDVPGVDDDQRAAFIEGFRAAVAEVYQRVEPHL